MKKYDIIWVEPDKEYFVIEHDPDSEHYSSYIETLYHAKRGIPSALAGTNAFGSKKLEDIIDYIGSNVCSGKDNNQLLRRIKLEKLNKD